MTCLTYGCGYGVLGPQSVLYVRCRERLKRFKRTARRETVHEAKETERIEAILAACAAKRRMQRWQARDMP